MKFIQFYQLSVPGPWNDYIRAPIEATGDRSVIRLDGRERPDLEFARSECAKRKYVGFTLMSGANFVRGVREIRPYEAI